MTQIEETTKGQILSSSDNILPALQDNGDAQNADGQDAEGQDVDASATAFIDTALEKVQLDLDDAPFLQDDEDEEETKTETGKKSEKTGETTEEGEEVKPKSKKKIILIVLATFVILILAFASYYVYNILQTPGPVLQNFITIPSPPESTKPAFYEVTLDPFWVDLENTDHGPKFLVGKFVVRMESEDTKKELELNLKKIRDAIYYYLVSVDHEFLIDIDNREIVRNGIIDIVNPYLVSGQIENIYFDSFLLK